MIKRIIIVTIFVILAAIISLTFYYQKYPNAYVTQSGDTVFGGFKMINANTGRLYNFDDITLIKEEGEWKIVQFHLPDYVEY